MPEPAHVLVAGDVLVDYHLYEGERPTPTSERIRGAKLLLRDGGAVLLAELIRAVIQRSQPPTTPSEWQSTFGLQLRDAKDADESHRAYAVWRPYPALKEQYRGKNPKKPDVWRAHLLMGYGPEQKNAHHTPGAPLPIAKPPRPRILVLDDAGFAFRRKDSRDSWLLPIAGQDETAWILLKMSEPVAQGHLWHEVVAHHAGRLVCVVSARDLRREQVGINEGLSWEQTILDLYEAMEANSVLAALRPCRHLIIAFSVDGALWLDRVSDDTTRATLIFHDAGAEGEFAERTEGRSVGFLTTLTAAVAHVLMRTTPLTGKIEHTKDIGLECGIAAGLQAMRDLQEQAHGEASDEKPPTGFPVDRIADEIIKPAKDFVATKIAWPPPSGGPGAAGWMIVADAQRPPGSSIRPSLLGLSRLAVMRGQVALKGLPHARFGKLLTVDRAEIEGLRNVRRLMRRFQLAERPKRPLSIGIFGPPGAGKSFGVKQLAIEVFTEQAWLEFNLSQFTEADLIGALHQVRDRVLGGTTPVVFWDEFDSHGYQWLQYLLAPMQDGLFQEGPLSHPVGKCIFVFAGGVASSFAELGTPESDEFRQRKVPDFKSRLDAYYDVLGPNPRQLSKPPHGGADRTDPADVCYPLRRALLIRAHLTDDETALLDVDPDMLDALLLVSRYQHGARSLEKVVASLRPDASGTVRRSRLPPPSQLEMHVPVREFTWWLERNAAFRNSDMIEALARAIHAAWLDSTDQGQPDVKRRRQPSDYDREYDALDPIDQEDNRAAARRIPETLALAGLGVVDAQEAPRFDTPTESEVKQIIKLHLERLAEAEHDGWIAHRRRNGWRQGEPRNNDRLIHDRMVPYAQLPDHEQDKDRDAVRNYSLHVERAECQIVWLPTAANR